MVKLNISSADENDIVEISKNLILYNNEQVPFTQNPPFIPIHLCVKEGEELVGGIIAQINCWDTVSIEALWIKEDCRGKGYARSLVENVEELARKKNCRTSQLDTFDFQAKGLYEKLGYTVFGILEDSPVGHNHYYMSKRID